MVASPPPVAGGRPHTFDPVIYIGDMHDLGATLVPFVSGEGRRVFSIKEGTSGGIPGDVTVVGAKWAEAAKAHPDWVGAVHDALIARRGGL